MQGFALYPFDPPGDVAALRTDLRAWLAANQPTADIVARANCWASFDAGFSRALGAAGYVGMTLPARYGRGDRHPLERYVVIEDLLAACATAGAHSIDARRTRPTHPPAGRPDHNRRTLAGIAGGALAGR